MARLNFLDFSTLWVAFGFRLFQAAYYINIQQLASNQDFSFFGANGNIILKFSGKSRKLKCATAGNRTTDLLLSTTGLVRESYHGSPAHIYIYIYIYIYI